MIISNEQRIRSEIEAVRRMLAEVPEEFVTDRLSLQARIDELSRELSKVPKDCETLAVRKRCGDQG